MNKKILQKCVDALNAEEVDVSYIRGILETLIESIPETTITPIAHTSIVPTSSSEITDEAKALEYMAKAKLEETKRLAGEQ